MKLIFTILLFLTSICLGQDHEWEFFRDVELLSENIETIAIDNSGCLWFGAFHGAEYGIVKYDGNECINFNETNSGLPTNGILCIYIDNVTDSKWIGTDGGGLVKFDGINWTVYNTDNSDIPGDEISSIAIDESGSIWVGTGNGYQFSQDRGLARFDGVNWTVYNNLNNHDLRIYSIQGIVIDSEGETWIAHGRYGAPASYGYISQLLNSEFNVYFVGDERLADTFCKSIIIDENNYKWIATTNKGLVKIDSENSVTMYNTDNSSIPDDQLNSIVEDIHGIKWITYGFHSTCGIIKQRGDSVVIYTHGNFRSPNYVPSCIAIDDNDNKWIGTSRGLVRFKENITSIDSDQEPLVNSFSLMQNYPNPFNPTTTLKYSIPRAVNSEKSIVNLKIFDVLGKEVATLVNSQQRPGNYEVNWDATGQSSGVYFYKLTAGSFTETKKMVLLR